MPKFQASVNKHGVEHHIATHGHPIFARPRRLPADKFSAAKDEFTKMKEAGIVRQLNSPWSSPFTYRSQAVRWMATMRRLPTA